MTALILTNQLMVIRGKVFEVRLWDGDKTSGFEELIPAGPVSYLQGTIEKLEEMRLRAERGQELHVPGTEHLSNN